jgi:tetratricopeptide (TPR) repeat protein
VELGTLAIFSVFSLFCCCSATQKQSSRATTDSRAHSKSQIAIEFTYRIRDSSPQTWVFWVDAKDVASVKASYRKIAKALQLPGHDEQDTDILALVRDWLQIEANGPWIMVIDSADNTSVLTEPVRKVSHSTANTDVSLLPELREFMPLSQNGCMLITSTNTEAAQMLTGNCAHHVEVEEMNEAEALALLKSKLHSKVVYTEDEAKELVKAAEYMPLAISQTAARISMDYPRVNLTQAIERLKFPDQDATRLLEGSVHETNRDTRRTNSVVKSWHLSFQYVREKSPSAARLLSLMCLFDRQGIPEALLTGEYGEEVTATLAPARPRLAWWKRLRKRRLQKHKRMTERKTATEEVGRNFDKDWRVLNNLMLIKTNLDGHHFNMHRLIQHTTARWLEINGEWKAWTKKYVSIMKSYFPKPEHDNWKVCGYLNPHAQRTVKYQPTDQSALGSWAILIQDIAQFAYVMSDYSTAEALYRTALKTLLAIVGERHEETLTCLHGLGLVLSDVHNYPEAERVLRRAREGRSVLLGMKHIDTLDTTHKLGSALNAQEKWDEGEGMHMRVVEGYEHVFGPTHIETQSLMSRLSLTYLSNGRLEQAENLHRRVCSIRIDAFGEDSNAAYECRRALAALLTMQGKASEAEIIHRQVAQASEARAGLHNMQTIRCINFLGEALIKQRKFDEAGAQYRRILDVLTDLDGDTREEALASLDSLAQVLSQQGQLEEAETIARQMIAEREKLLGPDNVDTLIGYHTLAEILTKQEQFELALEMYEKSYIGTNAKSGPDHPDTVEFLNDFNAAKNRILVYGRDESCSLIKTESIKEHMSATSIAMEAQPPGLVMV